jgi:hypothetical protein
MAGGRPSLSRPSTRHAAERFPNRRRLSTVVSSAHFRETTWPANHSRNLPSAQQSRQQWHRRREWVRETNRETARLTRLCRQPRARAKNRRAGRGSKATLSLEYAAPQPARSSPCPRNVSIASTSLYTQRLAPTNKRPLVDVAPSLPRPFTPASHRRRCDSDVHGAWNPTPATAKQEFCQTNPILSHWDGGSGKNEPKFPCCRTWSGADQRSPAERP